MSSVAIRCPQPHQFIIEGELSMQTLASSNALVKQLDLTADISLDLANVSHFDSAGLAWLLHVVSMAEQNKSVVAIMNAPQSLIKLAKISNADALLPLQ